MIPTSEEESVLTTAFTAIALATGPQPLWGKWRLGPSSRYGSTWCAGYKRGPRTNGMAQVLNVYGAVIPGFYGAGNVISNPTGSVYAGAGGTLGPALTFGYIAGQSAARSEAH